MDWVLKQKSKGSSTIVSLSSLRIDCFKPGGALRPHTQHPLVLCGPVHIAIAKPVCIAASS